MIIDAHCDALLKLWSKKISFYSSDELQVDYKKWMDSSVKVQCFAIFVPDDVPDELQFKVALQMVDIFFEQIIKPYDNIKFISNKQDLLSLQDNERGAILTLEGCHAIGHDLIKLKTLIRLGVRAVGLTWNQGNAVCDGIGEERGAGLSSFGKEVIHYLNEQKIWTDVSHLSYKGFFDVMNLARYPMASHSNAYSLTNHRRNLDDKQIKILIKKNGWIGTAFIPFFLTTKETATHLDVIRHIQYYIQLGAGECLGFGSDFDGADEYVNGLQDHSDYDSFIYELKKVVSSELLHNISYQNFINKFPRNRG